jgi:YesN/AraC family two-component response regulator
MQQKIAKLKRLKILFVEDEKDLIKIISDTLTKLQVNFVTANDGVEALEKINENPDLSLVVTDINMPNMNGLEMIEEARKTKPDLKFIIMSAHTEPEYLKTAERLGISEYLLKPFDFIKFINLVGDLELPEISN